MLQKPSLQGASKVPFGSLKNTDLHFPHVAGAGVTVGPRPESGPQLASWWPHRFPQGLEDVSTYPVLIEELLRRGWREEELQGVLRGNLLRVFRQVEQVCWAGQKDGSVFQQVAGMGGGGCWGSH